jgi:hypothetical protein
MTGVLEIVTVEDIAGWDEDLSALTDGLGWLFNRPEPRVTFGLMVRALLADMPKNSWGLAEHIGSQIPQPSEHLLGGARWDADALRDAVRSYVLKGLADPGALVLDDTQVVKKGVKSVGVAPQHCGLTGQTKNCQVMVMLSYASYAGTRSSTGSCICRPRGPTIPSGARPRGCPQPGSLSPSRIWVWRCWRGLWPTRRVVRSRLLASAQSRSGMP